MARNLSTDVASLHRLHPELDLDGLTACLMNYYGYFSESWSSMLAAVERILNAISS